jgi:hypothetical protein
MCTTDDVHGDYKTAIGVHCQANGYGACNAIGINIDNKTHSTTEVGSWYAISGDSYLTYSTRSTIRIQDGVFEAPFTSTDTQMLDSITPTSITALGTTATVTLSGHGLSEGASVIVLGANEAIFNGTRRIDGVTLNAFTYTLTGELTGSATGSITIRPDQGSEPLWQLPREMFTVRVDGAGNNLVFDVNIGGTIKSGTVSLS